VLLDAVSQVSGSPSEFKDKPKGTRALQLADSNVESYFLSAFGRPERVITCDCERSNEPSMKQVLHLYNGDTINAKLRAAGNRIEAIVSSGESDEQVIEEAYLSTLSRFPTEQEKTELLAVFAESSADERRLVIEDLYWGLLSSREFLFNH
jgi:hypothetical protein